VSDEAGCEEQRHEARLTDRRRQRRTENEQREHVADEMLEIEVKKHRRQKAPPFALAHEPRRNGTGGNHSRMRRRPPAAMRSEMNENARRADEQASGGVLPRPD